MDLERLIAALAPTQVVGRAPGHVRDLAYDARSVTPGALFFCVSGARADGHDYAPAAASVGAVALAVEHPLELPLPQLVVPDARAAMAVAADLFFGHPTHDLAVAGVTGTNGKTTTTFLLHSILGAAGLRPGLLGTVESRIGDVVGSVVRTTPEAIDLQRAFRSMLDVGNRSCAVEASSHGSVLRRLDRVRFAALVFTNLTQDHLDFHGTMERYFEAKRRLFVSAEQPPAAINVDDPFGRRLAQELRVRDEAPVLTFGLGADADVHPAALELTAVGVRMEVEGAELQSPLRGRFNAVNVLGAVAAGRLLGIEPEAIAAGVERLRGVPGRFEAIEEGQPFTVIVDYAHTPDSLENVLRTARPLAEGRLVCIFGCGGERDRGKRPLMGRVASELADETIVTSDNPRGESPEAIIEQIVQGARSPVAVEPDRALAIEAALESARAGDVVVIAGKGHEPGQQIGAEIFPFDDREVARHALRRLRTPA